MLWYDLKYYPSQGSYLAIMTINEYFQLLRQKLWFISTTTLVTGSLVFLALSQKSPTYRAEVIVSIGGYIQSPNPTSLDIRAGVELAQTYAVLATTNEILDAATQEGHFPVNAEELHDLVEARVVPATSLLVISVTYTDPEWASEMANMIATQLIARSPTNLTPIQQAQVDLASSEIRELSLLVGTARDQLNQIEEELSHAADAQETEALRERQNVLITQITLASSTIAQYSNTIVSLQERTNSLTIVERATVPTSPSGFGRLPLSILGAIVGAIASGVFVLLSDYLSNTVRRPHEATALLEVPVIGVIPIKNLNRPIKHLDLIANSASAATESYRAVRAKLLFPYQGRTNPFLFVSHSENDGKSVMIAGLGIVIAQAGLRVLLIDANFHQPSLHTMFNLPAENGLGTLLAQELDLDEADRAELVASCVQVTPIANLSLLAAGPAPADSAGVFGSQVMARWLQFIETATKAHIILMDTSPLSSTSDAFVLAVGLQTPVVVIVRSGTTPYEALIDLRAQIKHFGITLAGIVLINR